MPVIAEPFIRENYVGLNDAEDDLLRKYLLQRDLDVQSMETQISLGPGEELPESLPDAERRQWQESSKLKLDVLVERPSVYEVIELKDFVRTSALGQLMSYRYWLEIERDLQKPLRLWAVAPDMNPSAAQPYRQAGVSIHMLEPEGRRHLQQGLEAQPPFEIL